MSIKIYDGLKSTTGTNPFITADKIRKIIEPMFFDQFEETLNSRHGSDPHEHYKEMQKSFDSPVSNFELPDMDFGYAVVLLPKGLVMVFSANRRYREALMTAGVVEDYGYWNNSDEPEDVTEQQWRKRKQDWSIIFDKSPAQVGLQFFHPSRIDTVVELMTKKKK